MPRLRASSGITVSDAPSGVVRFFDPFRIKPFAGQIRKRFRGIRELAASIDEVGQTTPIKVRVLEDTTDFDAELVDGERRLFACRSLKRPVEAYIDTGVVDVATQFAHCVAANFGRQDHDCLEIAQAIQKLKDFGKTTAQIAAIFGKSVAWVAQHTSLLRLAPEVQQMLIPADEKPLEVGDADDDAGADLTADGDFERATIPFSIALLLVPLPFDLQRRAAEEIREMGMSMVGARRYVRGVLRDSGRHHNVRQRPKEQWQGLESLCSRLRDMVGTYLDMQGQEFDHILRATAQAHRLEVAKALRSFSREVIELAECIEAVK